MRAAVCWETAFQWQISTYNLFVYRKCSRCFSISTRSLDFLLFASRCAIMARAKSESPAKGKKTTTVKKAITVLRRSPRKAVQSAKKAAADEDAAPEKVVKRVASKKTTTKFPSPEKKSTKVTTTASQRAIPTSAKKAKQPDDVPTPLASPRPRGRPKKETQSPTANARSTTPKQTKVAASKRARTPTEAANVPAPAKDADWTDSPKKRSPSKTSSKNTKRAGSVGGIRKSIELPDANKRGRDQDNKRNVSRSPSRGRSKSATKSSARKPVKAASTASTRSKSTSPVRKHSYQDVPAMEPQQDLAATSTKAHCGRGSKAQSPDRRRSRSVPRDNARKTATTKQSRSVGSRSQSPGKLARPQSRQVPPPLSPTPSPTLPPPKPRGRPRSPSVGSQNNELRVGKTRGPQNPTKRVPDGLVRARTVSPTKSLQDGTAARKASDTAKNEVGGRSRSPSKPLGHSSPVRASSANTVAFGKRFSQNDDYGRALKRIERIAYQCTKEGKDAAVDHDSQISKDDEDQAKQRGVRRAQLEMRLNTEGAIVPDRVLQRSSASPERSRTSRNGTDDSTGANATSARKASNGVSPNRHRSSGNSQSSPTRGTQRSVSQSSAASNKSKEDNTPLSEGQPSGKGRGTIHSVTNPEFIPDTTTLRKNPFFETMPGAEIWHRRMPHFLPFGETPYMEKVMSRQISEDLARG